MSDQDDLESRVRAQCMEDDAGHLWWQGRTDRRGRATFDDDGGSVNVRRLLWCTAGGKVPEDHTLQGRCHTGRCVAPAHTRLFHRPPPAPRVRAPREVRHPASLLVASGECMVLPRTGTVYWQGRLVKIARAVWEAANGPVEKGWSVCHRCDTAACGLLEHLYLQQPHQRVRETADRFRLPLGEDHGQAKLTWDAVEFIRASTASRSELAEAFGVSSSTIRKVRFRETWRHRPSPSPPAG